jgi:hypothetical protein
MLSLQDVQGDKNLINLVENWEALEEYSGKDGFYQIFDIDGKVEVRVSSGKLGFRKGFDKTDDALLIRILTFCSKHRFIQISENVKGEVFFK